MRAVKTLDDLMELAHGYQGAMALFTALRLDLFTALSRAPSSAPALARRLGADPGRLDVLLSALAALGLLGKSGSTYRAARGARTFLARGPRSRRSILLHHLDCWRDWSGLEAKIRGGRRPPGGDGDFQDNFIRGMEDNSRERAAAVARRFRFRPGERVLDLGGGPGTYAVAWAKASPGVDVTLVDVPETLRVTRRILRENRTAALVRLRAADFLKDPIGGPYDFIWISQILHAFSPGECVSILRRAKGALARGGRAAVQEFLVDEGRTSPRGPAMFSLHMVAVTAAGRAYSRKDVAAMLREAGFRRVAALPPDARGVGILTGS